MDDKQLLDCLTELNRSQSGHVEKQIGQLNLSNGRGGVLFALGSFGEMSQHELAEYRNVTAATISNMLMRMERDGLITRKSSSDGKSNIVSLTDDGRDKYKKLSDLMDDESKAVFKGFTKEEKEQLGEYIRRLIENVR